MKILFLTDNFFPEVNAGASRVFERAVYWVKWGHDVTVLTSAPNFPQGQVYEGYKNKWYQRENISGIEVIRVKTFIAPNKGTVLRILDFLSYFVMSFIVGLLMKKPDVVIASSPQFFINSFCKDSFLISATASFTKSVLALVSLINIAACLFTSDIAFFV